MKKLLSLLFLSLLLVALAACSSDSASSDNKESKEEEKTEEKEATEQVDGQKAVRSALLSYQGEVTKLIRSTEAGLSTEGADQVEVATKFGTDLATVSIPAELADHQADLEASVESLKQYYAKKAELLKAGSEDLAEADKLKEEYVTSVTKVFEAVELTPPLFKSLF
ncbi:hypothetical protein LS684_11155 [Cytobacillus spongiae]|uniref:hypothetical protein n=1 Tax=Cytobacillus spongiae TaxID=2901381 RepID=UPI001F1BE21E|nr:hypothetical protein [Cytobacillus spongiae]UII54250.1 hypothetical protein LS684_11155 [Cytobacillus spongiae]